MRQKRFDDIALLIQAMAQRRIEKGNLGDWSDFQPNADDLKHYIAETQLHLCYYLDRYDSVNSRKKAADLANYCAKVIELCYHADPPPPAKEPDEIH